MATVQPLDQAPSAGSRLGVAVCVPDRLLLEQICGTLVAGGHSVVARAGSTEDFQPPSNGSTPASIVTAGRRPDSATLAQVRLLRSHAPDAAVVLVCERSSAADIRRALEGGVDGLVLVDEMQRAL